MFASALVDRPGWQLLLVLVGAVASGVFAYHYTAWRARSGSERGSGLSAKVTKGNVGIDQSRTEVHQSQTVDRSVHRTYITVNPAPRTGGGSSQAPKSSAFADWLDEAGIGGIVLLGFLAWAAAAVVANAYVDVRSQLLLALFVAGSVTTGLTFGAWLGVRRYRRFDTSWRAPLRAAAVICAATFADMWLLTHPLLRTGTLQEVMQPFLHNRGGILDAASKDDDATQFLALQGVGAAGAVLACGAALVYITILWVRVDRQLHGRRPRLARVDAGGALMSVAVLSVLCALLTSGLVHRLIGGSTALGPPELQRVTFTHGRLQAGASEPGRLEVVVLRRRHGKVDTSTAARVIRECRPGRRCAVKLRPALANLPHGNYELQVRAVDEGGARCRAWKHLVKVPLHR